MNGTRVDERELRVPVKAGDTHSGPLRRRFDDVQVLVHPAPKLHILEAVVLRCLESIQKGKLSVHGPDAKT